MERRKVILLSLIAFISLCVRPTKAQAIRNYYPCTCQGLEACWRKTCYMITGDYCTEETTTDLQGYVNHCIVSLPHITCTPLEYKELLQNSCAFIVKAGISLPPTYPSDTP